MSKKKEILNPKIFINSEGVNFELEAHSECKQDILGKLYKILDWDNDTHRETLTKIERVHHYQLAQLLHNMIQPIKTTVFLKDKKLNPYYQQKVNEGTLAVLLSMFISYKENYIGKKGYSRNNVTRRIVDEDLHQTENNNRILDIPNEVVINKTENENISNIQIISQIRDALSHVRYIVNGKNLDIKNPQKKFEAEAPIGFLIDFIEFCIKNHRKKRYIGMKSTDNNIFVYQNRFNFDWFKENIHFYEAVNDTADGNTRNREILLTDNSEKVIKKYFNKHSVNYKNINYLMTSLRYPPEEIMWEIFVCIQQGKTNKLNELIDHIFRCEFSYYGYLQFLDGESSVGWINEPERTVEEKEALKNLGEKLLKIRHKKLKSGKNILDDRENGIVQTFILIENDGFEPDVEKGVYRKGDVEIRINDVMRVYESFYNKRFIAKQIVETFPNWLKLQFIKYVYINELVTLRGNVEGGTVNPDDNFTKREHIRNALTHNNYTMLHGVNDIVLRDGYNKGTDTWDWEEIIDLQKLYENTYNEMINNINSEDNIIILDKDLFS